MSLSKSTVSFTGLLNVLTVFLVTIFVFFQHFQPVQSAVTEQPKTLARSEHQIIVERVKDGDTIVADIRVGLGVVLDDQEIRFDDFDAWESTKRRDTVDVTDDEVIKGKRAADELRVLVAAAPNSVIGSFSGKRDVYGRWLASVKVADVQLRDWAERQGHIRK